MNGKIVCFEDFFIEHDSTFCISSLREFPSISRNLHGKCLFTQVRYSHDTSFVICVYLSEWSERVIDWVLWHTSTKSLYFAECLNRIFVTGEI